MEKKKKRTPTIVFALSDHYVLYLCSLHIVWGTGRDPSITNFINIKLVNWNIMLRRYSQKNNCLPRFCRLHGNKVESHPLHASVSHKQLADLMNFENEVPVTSFTVLGKISVAVLAPYGKMVISLNVCSYENRHYSNTKHDFTNF